MKLALHLIEEDGGTQSRDGVDAAKVVEYSEILEALPPVIVFYDGSKYWLADGFHRVAAAVNVGAKDIVADVRQGTLRDAVFFSLSANATHGIPRSNADKRRAVLRALADEEWGAWSDREIARTCRVSPSFVASLRPSLSTVDSENTERRYKTRHGTEAVMNVGAIGRGASSPSPRPASSAPLPPPSAVVASSEDDLHTAARLETQAKTFLSALREASPRARQYAAPALHDVLRQMTRLAQESAA